MLSLRTFNDFRVVGKHNDLIEIKHGGKKYVAPIEGEAPWMETIDVFTEGSGKDKKFIAYFEDKWSHYEVANLQIFSIIDGRLVNMQEINLHLAYADFVFGKGWRKKHPRTKAKLMMKDGSYGTNYSFILRDGEVVRGNYPADMKRGHIKKYISLAIEESYDDD